jgi:hypothetical protein
MPKYTVTHPETGRKITLTGTAPPSEADLDDIFAQTASDAPTDRRSELAKGAKMTAPESQEYASDRAAFAQEGGVSMFGGSKGGDTRKINYTDTGYRRNEKPGNLRDLAKNAVQNVVEAPLMPVQMLAGLANAPDTGQAAIDMVKAPLGFVPYVSEMATGKPALENWGTDPVYGAMTLAGVYKGVKGGAAGAKNAVMDRVTNMEGDMLGMVGKSKPAPVSPLAAAINTGIDKGIRPGVGGNRTFAQSSQYHQKAQQAVKTIIDNHSQGALSLTDEFGEATQGLPQNLRQFSQAIDQSKRNIYQQYNEMATTAGESGAVVDLTPIPKELMSVANNRALQKAAPGVAQYASERAKAFSGQSGSAQPQGVVSTPGGLTFTAEEAQQAIAIYNQSLEAFNKNPSYDTASRAYIDSLIVNNIRKGLDASIEKATGPGYQALKNEYGALKTIEKDVSRRAIVDARKNPKGLLDFSDVFSGGQVVNGLLSMNPATVGTGLASKIIANFYKRLNDPNKIVDGMFKKAEKMYTPKGRRETPVGTPLAPKPNPNAGFEGRVNTLNLPQGQQRVFDPSTGQMIEKAQVPQPANNQGVTQPVPKPMPLRRVNSAGLNAPADNQLSPDLLRSTKPTPPKTTQNTWREFLSANMAAAMKSEGGHGAAVRKLAAEWKKQKN